MNYNGFEITVKIGCENVTRDKLIELENAIAKIIEESDCVVLGGSGKYKKFNTV